MQKPQKSRTPQNDVNLAYPSFHYMYVTKTRLFKYIKILPPKNENIQLKNSDILYISAQKINCGYALEPPRPRRGGSNAYPQSMFLSRIKKNNVNAC